MIRLITPAYAQGIDIKNTFPLASIFESVGSLVTSIINFAIGAAGVLFFFLLIWGGFRFMTARGDDKAMGEARQTITSALIGLLIILAAFIIIQIIFQVTGFSATGRRPF